MLAKGSWGLTEHLKGQIGGLGNKNLNHIRKLYTLLVYHCNSHGDRAYWQDCGISFISLDGLCWVHAAEQETEK
jgi:hypothetical protein